jgi:hypothetical protein
MSCVTNVIILAAVDEDFAMEQVMASEAVRNQEGTEARDFDESSGGPKHLEFRGRAFAFNYLDEAKLMQAIRQVLWKHPECVQVLMKGQEEERFKIVEVFG